MFSVTTLRVISLKVTRRAFSSGRSSSSFRCQEMASPSRSGSVARYTVSAFLALSRSSEMMPSRPLTGIYSGVKSFSTSTPILLRGRSRRWPMEATTLKSPPRYFSIVFAFAGDSTITSSVFALALAIVLMFLTSYYCGESKNVSDGLCPPGGWSVRY